MGTLALAAAAILAAIVVPNPRDTEPAPAFLTRALGSENAKAPLARTPAPGVKVTIDGAGYGVRYGETTVSLAAEGGAGAWTRYAHGVSRPTSFGMETITVDGQKAEQYLTVTKRQGPRTWRWKLQTGGAKPSVRPDGSIALTTGKKVSTLRILPVAVYAADGADVTPRDARWSLERSEGSWWVELRLDDSRLPLPYVVDPAIDYPSPLYLSNSTSGVTGSWRLLSGAPAAADSSTSTTPPAGATGDFAFKPGQGNTVATSGDGSTPNGLGWIVDTAGATGFPAGSWAFTVKTDLPSITLLSGSATLIVGVWKGTVSGGTFNPTQTLLPATDDPASQNLRRSLVPLLTTVTHALPAFTLGPSERLYVQLGRRQAAGVTSLLDLDRRIDLIVNDGAAQITHPPADDVAPATPAQSISEASPDSHASGSTFWYRAGGGSGAPSFTVTSSTSDSGSGIDRVSFPGLAGGMTPTAATDDPTSPYSRTYTWSFGTTESGPKTITAHDRAGNSSTGAFDIVRDASAPTGHSVALSGGPTYRSPSVPLTLTNGTDNAGGSGIDPTFQSIWRDSAPIVNGACGSFSGIWFGIALSAGADTGVRPGNCYRYSYIVSDNVANRSLRSASSGDAVVLNSGVGFRGASSGGTVGSSIILNKPTAAVENDLLLAQVTVNSTSVTITPPFGWTFLRRDSSGGGSNQLGQAIYYKLVGPSEPASYTWAFGAAVDASGGIVAEVGVSPTSPIDVSGGLAGSGTSPTAPSVTTTAPNERLVAFFGTGASTAYNPPTAMVERYDAGGGQTSVSAADENHAAAGATGTRVASAISAAASSPNIGQLVALRTDVIAPSTPTVSLTESSPDASVSGSVLFYSPGGAGSFTVDASATDGQSGLQAIVMPGLESGFTPSTEIAATARAYTWTPGASESGAKTVTAYDQAGNTATATFTLTPDSISPSGGSVSYPDGSDADGIVTITTSNGTDSEAGVNAGSGVIERQTATLSADVCGSFGAWASVTSPDEVAAATCARYRYRVSDNVGNQVIYTSANIVKVVADTSPPSAPALAVYESPASAFQHVSATTIFYNPQGTNSGSFAVDASTTDAGSGIQKVHFPALTGVTGGGDDPSSPYGTVYDWTSAATESGPRTVTAYDNAGNTSTGTFVVTPDSAAPSGGSVSYTDGYDGDGQVAISTADGTDAAAGIASGVIERRTVTLTDGSCEVFSGPWQAAASPDTVASGACAQYRYRVSDRVGNEAFNSSANVVKVDLAAPNTTILTGPSDPSATTEATLTFAASEGGSTFECRLDSGTYATCTTPKNYVGLAEGAHTFQVRATDAAGNLDPTPAMHVWTVEAVDVTPPAITLTSKPSDPSNTDASSFAFTASEAVGGFRCRLDGGALAPCSSPKTFAGLAEGSHTFVVEATDLAGHLGSTSYTWLVDVTPPSASQNNPGTPLEGTVELQATASDAISGTASATFQVSPAGEGQWSTIATSSGSPFTIAWDTLSVNDGRYDLRVVVADRAGNSSTSSVVRNRQVTNHPPVVSITAPDDDYVNGSAPAAYTITAVSPSPNLRQVEFFRCTNASTSCSTGVWASLGVDPAAPYSAAWTVDADGNRALKAVVTNNAWAEGVDVNNITIDRAPPAGGSVTYADGYDADGSVPVSGLPGTDVLSGVDLASGLLERQVSPLGDGACGAGGSWEPAFDDPDAVPSGICARYRYRISDEAGNEAVYTSLNLAKVDLSAPTVGFRASIELTGAGAQHFDPASDTLFFRPSGSGSFSLAASVTDAQSAAASASFPDLSVVRGWAGSGGLDSGAPYDSAVYAWSAGADAPGLRTIAGLNGAGLSASRQIAVAADAASPSGGSVDYPNEYDRDGTLTVAAADGSDSGAGLDTGSGVLERRTAPLGGGSCGSFNDPWASASSPDTIASDVCAQYRYRVSDLVGNEAVYTSDSVAKIDTAAPSVTLVDPGAALRGVVALSASASDPASGIASVTFERSPAGSSDWTPVATAWDTSAVPDGAYDLRALARDGAGNVAVSAAVLARHVDNRPPTISLALPVGYVNAASPDPFPLTVTSPDGDVASVELFRCDNESSGCAAGSWVSLGVASALPHTVPWQIDGDGNRAVRAVAVDTAGNTGAIVGEVAIDRTAPSLSLAAERAPGGLSADTTIEVAFLAAADPASGIDGFSYVWDTIPGTVPDTVKEAEEGATGASSPALPDGSWYFHLRARDNAGNWGQPLHLGPFPVDASAPAAIELSPLAPFQLQPAIRLAWNVEAGAAAELRYRSAGVDADFGAFAGVPTGGSAGTASVTAALGSTLCFSGRSMDAAGNASAWSLESCTALPLKAASLTRRGAWSKREARGHYAGSYLLSSARGASLAKGRLVARRLALVATKCRGCGTVAAYWNGRLLKRVALTAPKTSKAQIIPLGNLPSTQPGTLRLVVSSSGKPVLVEGLGISRI